MGRSIKSNNAAHLTATKPHKALTHECIYLFYIIIPQNTNSLSHKIESVIINWTNVKLFVCKHSIAFFKCFKSIVIRLIFVYFFTMVVSTSRPNETEPKTCPLPQLIVYPKNENDFSLYIWLNLRVLFVWTSRMLLKVFFLQY